MSIKDLIGKKIIAVKALVTDKRKTKDIPVQYIVFNDKETYINLKEQDYYSHHDCDTSARIIRIYKDKKVCEMLLTNPSYKDSTIDP